MSPFERGARREPCRFGPSQRPVLFDIHESTLYPDHPELVVYAWQPFKTCQADELLDWMRARGLTPYGYFNDLKWFRHE